MLLPALLPALALAACGGGGGAAPVTAGTTTSTRSAAPEGAALPLDGTTWVVEALQVRGHTVRSTRVRAWLRLDGRRVRGSLGCNRFSGRTQLVGDVLTLPSLRFTVLPCPWPQPWEAGLRELLPLPLHVAPRPDGSVRLVAAGHGHVVLVPLAAGS